MCNIEEYRTAIEDIPDYVGDGTVGNLTWQGKILSVPEAAKLFNVLQSDLTALANNKGLYLLKATAVYKLKYGTVLEISHLYGSTKQLEPENISVSHIGTDSRRRVIAPKNWSLTWTYYINSNYDFGYMPDGTKGYMVFADDINTSDFGYLKNESRYYIPASALDTTNKDNDGLYDVYEYFGMRLSNGNLFYTSPEIKDMDGDLIRDGEEIVLCEDGSGLFKMLSNPIEKDSDGDEIEDKVDPNPLKTNKTPDVNVTIAIVFPDTEPYNDGRAYYFSAYAQNNTLYPLMNYGFDIRFYYGEEETPTEDEFTITDPSSLGVMVIDESKTEVKHILPSLFAEKLGKSLLTIPLRWKNSSVWQYLGQIT